MTLALSREPMDQTRSGLSIRKTQAFLQTSSMSAWVRHWSTTVLFCSGRPGLAIQVEVAAWSTSSPDRSSRPRVLRTARLPPEGPLHRAADRSYCRHSRKNYTTARPCLDHHPKPEP